MLIGVEVGEFPKKDTLVITPEFFEEDVRPISDRFWGAYLRLRLYPKIPQWIAVSGVWWAPHGSFRWYVDRVQIFIPLGQRLAFSGKVLGYETIAKFRPYGFIPSK